MHGRVRRIPFADQLVRLVHAEVVLVAVEALIVPLRPARVLVLLGILGGLLFPSLGRLAGLDRLVLLLGVALLGHRHNRGVNDLSAARNVALGLKMLAEAFEQLVDQPGLRERLPRSPDRGGIRHWVLEVEIKKVHERQAVADQVLSLLIREIVERLQHHDLELQDRIVGLAASVALTLLGLRRGHALDVSAEVLPPHDLLDRFQRITFGADRLKPALNIEKARLPHDSLVPSAHGPLQSASQIRSDLARRIFRGALRALAGQFGLLKRDARTLLPGRASDGTSPMPTGSPTAATTIGMREVACLAASEGGVAEVTMTSTLRRTSSAAISARLSLRPSAQRYSMRMVRSSIQPSSRNLWTKAPRRLTSTARVFGPM